jgi:hypothetical protein
LWQTKTSFPENVDKKEQSITTTAMIWVMRVALNAVEVAIRDDYDALQFYAPQTKILEG